MRILHVLGSLNRGGAETWLVQVLRFIDRNKFQFDFAVHSDKPGAYEEEVKKLGARVIPCLSPQNPLKFASNFRRVLRDYGPFDCVHSHVHHFSGFVLRLAAGCGVPLRVAHSHNDTSREDARSSTLRKIYLRAMTSSIQRYATAGLAVSDMAGQSLFARQWRRDQRWNKCLLGIDLERFKTRVDAVKIRSELGLDGCRFVIGHVGRFHQQKNHKFIVEMARATLELRSDVTFLLIGDGPLRHEIEQIVRDTRMSGNFRFAGIRPDVPNVMRAAMDVFIFPSLYEGFGLAPLEAQAAGLHAVVSEFVPEEACMLPTQITRLSLTAGPRAWAEAVLKQRTIQKPSFNDIEPKLQEYGLPATANRLEAFYQAAMSGHPNLQTSNVSGANISNNLQWH